MRPSKLRFSFLVRVEGVWFPLLPALRGVLAGGCSAVSGLLSAPVSSVCLRRSQGSCPLRAGQRWPLSRQPWKAGLGLAVCSCVMTGSVLTAAFCSWWACVGLCSFYIKIQDTDGLGGFSRSPSQWAAKLGLTWSVWFSCGISFSIAPVILWICHELHKP